MDSIAMIDLFCDSGMASAEPDYSAVDSSASVVCSGAWKPAAASGNNVTNDDLSGLNTWDFAVMRSEFGDLQNIDSAALISLYRPEGAATSLTTPATMRVDDSIVDFDGAGDGTPRSRSDSGYSTSTAGGGACTGQASAWHPCARSFDCGSPELSSGSSGFGGGNSSSCSSSCHGGWSPPHHYRANATTATATRASGPRAAAQSRRSNCQRSRMNAAAAAASASAGSEADVKPAKKPRARVTKSRQLQLWQFLYHQLLQLQETWASPDRAPLRWESRHEGTFRIVNPTALAEAWGAHRRRSNMTYEKMSRTLRYYYDRKLITKVAGKQHTYRFHFDQFPDL